MTARFDPPLIQDNPTGWGPNTVPPKFKDMPYQPFSKADRLGKVSLVLLVYLLNFIFSKWHNNYCLNQSRSIFHALSLRHFRYLIGLAIRTKIAAI